MVSTEILLSLIISLLAWMRVSTATQERAFEFEQRLRNYFGVAQDGSMVIMNNSEDAGVEINKVTFHESDTLQYLLKKSFWPWQNIEGKCIFDIQLRGLSIDDTKEFSDTLEQGTEISSCTHEGHSGHYYLKIEGEPDGPDSERMINYESVLYYIANSKLATEGPT